MGQENRPGRPVTFDLEPIGDADFAFRYRVYEAAIKPYIDRLFDWDDARHEEMIRSNMAGSQTHFAIVVGGERVGIVQIAEDEDRISLHQIALLPRHQGRGIGTALIRGLMERSVTAHKPLHLSVFHLNTGARRLYERLGFQVVSESERDVQMRYLPAEAG